MKTEQELNNLRMTVAEDNEAIKNLTEKLDAARANKYHNTIILYQAETGLNIGDTVKWEWIAEEDYENIFDMKEPKALPIGEITQFTYSDYLGMRIHVKRDKLQVVLNAKDVLPINTP